MTPPLHAYLLLFSPSRVEERLAEIAERGLPAPNLWQIELGVLRMWHRVLFRFDSIGTSAAHRVRPTLRARVLSFRPFRFPFLLAERAIAPLDFSGLVSSRERILRHLLGAHHDGLQMAYDLELLGDSSALEELRSRALAVVEGADPRAEWLRDLTVYEGYHETLVEVVDRALAGDSGLSPEERRDPDISFTAYLDWCARQPATPRETLRALAAGRYTVADGVTA